jgi:two-component system CheB/CheR fusion protein
MPVEPEQDDVLSKIFVLLKARSGVDFTHYRRTTIMRRISRRMILRSIDKLENYANLLQSDAQEVDALFQDFLINVTDFFRDPEVFDAIKVEVLPKILGGRAPDDQVRIWVPACSTGEEAYSIAICILEYLEDVRQNFSIQIFATDVNEDVVRKARLGVYSEDIADNMNKERLNRFFIQNASDGYQVRKNVRDMCIFAKHNILTDPSFTNLDLISCRNLLIYMEEALQDRVISLFHYALKPNGFLIIGKSETISRFRDLFETVDKENKFYVKRLTTTSR